MDYLILCIGNRDGGDDAIGPYIADKLSKQKQEDLLILDCETTPENYTSIVKKHKPEQLIIIDAVDMGLTPGDIRIVPREKIGIMHISTHGIPLSILIMYLEKYVKTILFIGIQPKTMSGEINKAVKKSGDKLIDLIKNKRFGQIEKVH